MNSHIRRLQMVIPAFILVLLPIFGVAPSAIASPTITEYPVSSNSSYNTMPLGITAGPDGNVWFTEYQSQSIGKITPSGSVTKYIIPAPNGYFIYPRSIVNGSDGALWFTTYSGIGRIATDGTISLFSVQLPTAGEQIQDITAGPDGNLWFTEGDGTDTPAIGRLTTSGDVTAYTVSQSCCGPNQRTSGFPYKITSGSDNALWFTWSNGGQIGRITTTGISTEYPISWSYTGPDGITTGPDGALWIAGMDDSQTNFGAIGRMTTSSPGNITVYPIPSNSIPNDITTGPDGTLWIIEAGSDQSNTGYVGHIATSTGAISEYPVSTSPSNYPQHITAGPDGALWFTETGANKIVRFVPDSVPSSPTNLNASTPTQNPNLSWTAASDATSYSVYRNGTNIGTSTTTSYRDSSAPEGTDTYYVTGVNASGESSPSNSISVLVDRTAPTITASITPTPNNSGWNNTPATVNFTCADTTGGSGIAMCSSPQTESVDGTYTLIGTAVDNAGNTTSTAPLTLRIDQTKPTINSLSWSANPVTIGSSATLTASASDNGSGVAGGEYFIGNTDPGVGNGTPMALSGGTLSATFTLGVGVYTISVRSEDTAGNWSSPVAKTMLVVTDTSTTLGISGQNSKDLVPSLANGDLLPGLTSNTQSDVADYGMTVQYKNGILDKQNAFSFTYSTGTNCGKPNAQNCHTFILTASRFDWLVMTGTNNSQGQFQGTATLTIDGVTTTNPFTVIGIDGNRLTPEVNDSLILKVYAPGADLSTASPLYQASGSMASPQRESVKIQ